MVLSSSTVPSPEFFRDESYDPRTTKGRCWWYGMSLSLRPVSVTVFYWMITFPIWSQSLRQLCRWTAVIVKMARTAGDLTGVGRWGSSFSLSLPLWEARFILISPTKREGLRSQVCLRVPHKAVGDHDTERQTTRSCNWRFRIFSIPRATVTSLLLSEGYSAQGVSIYNHDAFTEQSFLRTARSGRLQSIQYAVISSDPIREHRRQEDLWSLGARSSPFI